jgi:hypothetical protein
MKRLDGRKTPRWVAWGTGPPRPWGNNSVTPSVTLAHPGLRFHTIALSCVESYILGKGTHGSFVCMRVGVVLKACVLRTHTCFASRSSRTELNIKIGT